MKTNGTLIIINTVLIVAMLEGLSVKIKNFNYPVQRLASWFKKIHVHSSISF